MAGTTVLCTQYPARVTIDMMETERHARLEKSERLLDIFDSCLVIDVLLYDK